jgi:hypothetical protein
VGDIINGTSKIRRCQELKLISVKDIIITTVIFVAVEQITGFIDVSLPLTPGCHYRSPISVTHASCLKIFNIIKPPMFDIVYLSAKLYGK